MADVEDDAEMGSHFLDSMLEVEMTEEDVELDVSKNEDPLDINSRSLPPVPMFDLQSETLSFKDVYRNTIQPLSPKAPHPRVQGINQGILPISMSTPKRPGLTIQPREMPTKNMQVPLKPKSPLPRILLRNKVPIKPLVRNGGISEEDLATQFIKQVFRSEYVKNVFSKKDPPQDISQVSKEEMDYYRNCFKDLSKVQYCRLHCTICDRHLGCSVSVEKRVTVHKMLKVLTCKQCFEFYGDGNFPCDKGDNCEIYCRWCGQGGALVCCSFCPRVFCKRCVRQNYGAPFLRSIQVAKDWACFCCAQKPLWPHRAICRALMKYIAQLKLDPKAPQNDTSKCCSTNFIGKRKLKPMERNDMVPQGQGQFGIPNILDKNPAVPLFKTSTPLPHKTISSKQPILKSNVQTKAGDQNKTSSKVPNVFNKAVKSSILPSGSVITGNNLLRNFTTNAPIKTYSGLPQLIKSPVLHGETLITPPVSKMLLQKSQANVNLNTNPSGVKVSVTTPGPHVDISKIPSVKIPHDVHGLVLRICFPDNKVQLVRLIGDKSECKAAKKFPMPEFKNLDELAFVEENLADSFKLSEMIYDKLLSIKEKVNSKTKFTEESVYASSVKKLHSIYEKSTELLKELDNSLLENFEIWKDQAKNPVDVIDISDEDSKNDSEKKKSKKPSNFFEKCKELLPSDDSDVEILDVQADANKEPFVRKTRIKNTNMKRHPVLMNEDSFTANWWQGSANEYMPHEIIKSITTKRRRGPGRSKRLKVDSEKKEENIIKSKMVNSNAEGAKETVDEPSSEELSQKQVVNIQDSVENSCEDENDDIDVEGSVSEENNMKNKADEENDVKDTVDEENDVKDIVDEENDVKDTVEEENDVKTSVDKKNEVKDSIDDENDIKESADQDIEVNELVDEENDEKEFNEENDEKEYVDEENDRKEYVDEENDGKEYVDEENDGKEYVDEENDGKEYVEENDLKEYVDEENDMKESVDEENNGNQSAEEGYVKEANNEKNDKEFGDEENGFEEFDVENEETEEIPKKKSRIENYEHETEGTSEIEAGK